MVALDVEPVDACGQAKAGGRCAIVAQVNGEMKVLFDKFVIPVGGDLSMCSARNKALASSNGMEFNDAVKRIGEILQHSIVVGHDIFPDLDIFAISDTTARAVFDTSECKALQELAGLPVKPGEKPALKHLAKTLLGRDIQKGRHDPNEDAYASLQLYLQNSHLFEEARRKPKGKASLDIDYEWNEDDMDDERSLEGFFFGDQGDLDDLDSDEQC